MMIPGLFELYVEAAKGQPDATAFLLACHGYFHAVDDLVDGDLPPNAENLITVLMQANAVYSSPFFIANSAVLSAVLIQIGNTYLDSVLWEREEAPWKKQVADVIRLCGNDIVRATANIVGGFPLMRSISLRLREFSWHNQHNEQQPEALCG